MRVQQALELRHTSGVGRCCRLRQCGLPLFLRHASRLDGPSLGSGCLACLALPLCLNVVRALPLRFRFTRSPTLLFLAYLTLLQFPSFALCHVSGCLALPLLLLPCFLGDRVTARLLLLPCASLRISPLPALLLLQSLCGGHRVLLPCCCRCRWCRWCR